MNPAPDLPKQPVPCGPSTKKEARRFAKRARKRLQYRRMHGTAPPVVRRTNLTHIAESAIRGEQKRKRVRRRGSAGAEAAIPRVFGEAAARKASPLAGIGAAIAACGVALYGDAPWRCGGRRFLAMQRRARSSMVRAGRS